MNYPENSFNKKNFPAAIAGGILSAALGVLALVLLHISGFPYTVYVPILMACVALASFLFSSAFLTGLMLKRMNNGSHPMPKKSVQWSYLLSLSPAILIIAPLAVILPSAQGISYAVYLPVFIALLIGAAMLLIVSAIGWFSAYRQLKK